MVKRGVVAGMAAVMLAMMPATSTQASWNSLETTYLTFSGPVSLPGLTLQAGTYIFERADLFVDNKVVRVLSSDRRHTYLMAFTNLVDRPAGLRPNQAVTIGEAPRGMAPRVIAWYPPDRAFGREFIYKN